jgi:cysteinyl-tRNA synthetase
MHNGFVRVDNEKMSKSLGNFFTIREVLEQVRRRDGALLHRARALPQPAQLQRCAPGRRAQALKRCTRA